MKNAQENPTVTNDYLIQELQKYKRDKPVYLSINNVDYSIDDVFLKADPDGLNGKITIETWEKTAK